MRRVSGGGKSPSTLALLPREKGIRNDRGRKSRLGSASPPSEPDVRVSRIRLSG